MLIPRAAVQAAAALALIAGAARVLAAPPSIILTGQIGDDMSADGLTVVGPLWDAGIGKHIVYSYTRAVGATRSGAVQDNDTARCSGNVSVVAFTAYDTEDLAGFGTDKYSPHLWFPGTGDVVNLGRPPYGDQCDAFTTALFDVASGGRYAVGGGYTAKCGRFRAQRYDILTDTWEQLPVSVSPPPIFADARATRADAVSADGTVVIGYDENYDNTFTQYWRGSAVWTFDGSAWTQTVLDRYYNGVKAVSADGNTLAGYMSTQTMQATFGTTTQYPVRWTRSGSSWIPHNMGGSSAMRPTAVSADGSTIVGTGASGGFISRASLNGGVPMSLSTYVSSLGGSFPGLSLGGSIYAISADGNTMLTNTQTTSGCLTWFPGAILYLNGAPCEPASVVLNPVSHFETNFPSAGYFIFNVFAAGTWPMTFQWQKETDVGSDVWVNLTDDNCGAGIYGFDYHGCNTMQLTLGGLSGVWAGRYRCVVSNSCGSATSTVARAATCFADFDCNNYVNGDDADMFGNLFFYGQSDCDVNGDGFVNGDDADAFGLAFDAGC